MSSKTQSLSQGDAIELDAIDKESEREEERFNFSMFFIMGTVFWLIGFFRMLIFRQIDVLNVCFVVVGLAMALGSQKWFKSKRLTASERTLLRQREREQFEIQASDFGYTQASSKKQETAEAPLDTSEQDNIIDIHEQASFDEERRL